MEDFQVYGSSLGKVDFKAWDFITSYDKTKARFGSFLAQIEEEKNEKYLSENFYFEARKLIQVLPKIERNSTEIPKKESNKDKIRRENEERLFKSAVEKFKLNKTSGYFDFYFLKLVEEALNNPLQGSLPFLQFNPEPLKSYQIPDYEFTKEKVVKNLKNKYWVDILSSDFQSSETLELRKCQKEILELTKKEKYLILFKSGLGSGKTTSSIILAKRKEIKVLYVCVNSLVRISVAQLAFASGISFGFATYDQIKKKLTYSWSQKTLKNAFEVSPLIICDYVSAQVFYRENPDLETILFLDEPTIGADNPDSSNIVNFIKLYKNYAPQRTILVSGTLPSYEDLKQLYDYHLNKYSAPIFEIVDKDVYVPLDLAINGTFWIPNNNEIFKKDPYLRRVLSKRLLLENLDTLSKTEFQKVRDFFVNDINNWDPEGIAQANEMIQSKSFEKSNKINIENLFSSEASKLFGGCLVVSNDPFYEAVNIAEALFHKLNLNWKKLEKSLILVETNVRITSGTKLEREKEQTLQNEEVKWSFPPYLQINSRQHFLKFSPNEPLKLQQPIFPSDVPDDLDPKLKILLVMGVGIYDYRLNSLYLETVSNLMMFGKLSYVFAEINSIAYGTNAPFSNMILYETKDLEKNSLATIQQLLARVGRFSSSKSFVYSDEKLIDFLINGNSEMEFQNILEIFNKPKTLINKK